MNKIIVYRESLIQSLLADASTFAYLLISFGINHLYIGSKMVAVILLIMFIIFVLSKTHTKQHIFTDRQKAIDFINKD